MVKLSSKPGQPHAPQIENLDLERLIITDPAPTSLIQSDIVCRLCGYNLRGLPRDGTCPECGGRIALPTQRYYLAYSPVWWLRRIGWGARLIACSAFMLPLGILSVLLIAWIGGARDFVARASLVVVVISSVFYFIGSWLLTTLDMSVPESLRFVRQSTLSRRILVVCYCAGLALFLALDWHTGPQRAVMNFILLPVSGLTIASQIHYVGSLIQRLPHPELLSLASFYRTMFIMFPIIQSSILAIAMIIIVMQVNREIIWIGEMMGLLVSVWFELVLCLSYAMLISKFGARMLKLAAAPIPEKNFD